MKTGDHQSENCIKLSRRQERVYNLLSTGKYSVADITIKLGYCDPRSFVRDLKEKGINVQDLWIQKDGVRYKVYFIPESIHPNVGNAKTIYEIIESDFKYLIERRPKHGESDKNY